MRSARILNGVAALLFVSHTAQTAEGADNSTAANEEFERGEALLHGTNGPPLDLAGAYDAYLQAAEKGHTGAQLRLGVRYYTGIGTAVDLDEAGYWFDRAAIGGDPVAMEFAAELLNRPVPAEAGNLENIPLRPVDPVRAVYWQHVLRSQNDSTRFTTRTHPYVLHYRPALGPHGALADPQFRTLLQRAESGDGIATVHAAISLYLMPAGDRQVRVALQSDDDPPPPKPPGEEFPFTQRRAEIEKLPRSQQGLGTAKLMREFRAWEKANPDWAAYNRAYGEWQRRNKRNLNTFEPPKTTALSLLTRSAAIGEVNALFLLGGWAANDPKAVRDLTTPLRHCLDRAEAGSREHAFLAGLLYLAREPATRQTAGEARRWLARAAEAGHAAAAARLGRELYEGTKLSRDLPGAAHHLGLAARAGRTAAAHLLEHFVGTRFDPAATAKATAKPAGETRLAVITGGGVNPDLADLLYAQLSERPGVALVERDELARILKEQSLDAGSAAARLNLGQLLNAHGLVFLERPASDTVSLRVVAGAQGVVVDALAVKLPLKDPVEWTATAADHVAAALPKLHVDRAQALPVSVVGISTPIVSPVASELERRLAILLTERLYHVPELFVLERRNARDLTREKLLSETPLDSFWSGAYLIEGEFNRNGGDLSEINLELRLKSPGTADPLLVVTSGKAADLPDVINRSVTKIAAALKKADTATDWSPTLEATRFLQEAQWALRWNMPHAALRAADAADALGNDSVVGATTRLRCFDTLLRPKTLPEMEALKLAPGALQWLNAQLDRPECADNLMVLEYGMRLLADASHLLEVFADYPTVAAKNSAVLHGIRTQLLAAAKRFAGNPAARQIKIHPATAIRLGQHRPVTTLATLLTEYAATWTEQPDAGPALAAGLLATAPQSQKSGYSDLVPLRLVDRLAALTRRWWHQAKTRLSDLPNRITADRVGSATWKSHAVKLYLEAMDRRSSFDAAYFNAMIPASGYSRAEAADVLGRLATFGSRLNATIDVKIRAFQLELLANPDVAPRSWKIVHITTNSLTVAQLARNPSGQIYVSSKRGGTFPEGTNGPTFQHMLRQLAPELANAEPQKPSEPSRTAPQQIAANSAQKGPASTLASSPPGRGVVSPATPGPQTTATRGNPIRADRFWTLPLSKVPANYGSIRGFQPDTKVFADGSWWFFANLLVADNSREPFPVVIEVPLTTLEPVFHDLPAEIGGLVGDFSPFQIAANQDVFVLLARGGLFLKPRGNPAADWHGLGSGTPPETRLWNAGDRIFRTDANSVQTLAGDRFTLLVSTKRRPAENPLDHLPNLHIAAVGSNGGHGYLLVDRSVFLLSSDLARWTEFGPRPAYMMASQDDVVFGYDPQPLRSVVWSVPEQSFVTRLAPASATFAGGFQAQLMEYPLTPIGDGLVARLETRLNIKSGRGRISVSKDVARRDADELTIASSDPPSKTKHKIEFSIPQPSRSIEYSAILGGLVPRLTWTAVGACVTGDRIPGFWLLPPETFGLPAINHSAQFRSNLAAGQEIPKRPEPASTPAKGNPEELFKLAKRIITDDPKRDLEDVKKLLEQAGEGGIGEAWPKLAEVCQKYPHCRDIPRGLQALQRGAKVEPQKTALYLDLLFKGGNWHTPEYTGAREWLRIGADLGGKNCKFQLGYLYHHGLDGPADFDAALHWYQKAHDAKQFRAARFIGLLYAGEPRVPGSEPDYPNAVEWLERALANRDPRAAYHLAGLHRADRYAAVEKVLPLLSEVASSGIVYAENLLQELAPDQLPDIRKKHVFPSYDWDTLIGVFEGDAGEEGRMTVTIAANARGGWSAFYQLNGGATTQPVREGCEINRVSPGFSSGFLLLRFTDQGLHATYKPRKRTAILSKVAGMDDPALAPERRLTGTWQGKWDDTWPVEFEFGAADRQGVVRGAYRVKEHVTDTNYHTSRISGRYQEHHGVTTLGWFQRYRSFSARLDSNDSDTLLVTVSGRRQREFASDDPRFKPTTYRLKRLR